MTEVLPGLPSDIASQPRGSRSRIDQRRFVRGALLACADLVAVEAALVIAALLIAGINRSIPLGAMLHPTVTTATGLSLLVLSFYFGLYDIPCPHPIERLRLRAGTILLLPWVSLSASAMVEQVRFPMAAMVIIAAPISMVLGLGTEALARRVLSSGSRWGARVVLIGSHTATEKLARLLLSDPARGLQPLGVFSDTMGGSAPHPLPYLGSVSDACFSTVAADLAVVALSPEVEKLDLSTLSFRRVMMIPCIDGLPTLGIRPRDICGNPGIEFLNPAHAGYNPLVKRMLDLIVTVPLFILSLPVILVACLVIKMVSSGSPFYVQRRVGWKGRTVRVFKLRSMYIDAEQRLEALLAEDAGARAQWQTHVKLSPDPRVLPVVGNFIRRTSIDELPQLWNIMRGDMSLVGPRPFPGYHLDRFDPDFQAIRTSLRPGLTGLWQVSDRSNADVEQQQTIDTFYIRNWSLWLDLYIVLRTLPALLSARGAR